MSRSPWLRERAPRPLIVTVLLAAMIGAAWTGFSWAQDCSGADVLEAAIGRPVGESPIALATGDFNEDGAPDLAAVSYGTNTVAILLGVLSGGVPSRTFSPAALYPAGPGPRNIAVVDVDQDGILDLAIPNLSGPSVVSVLKGQGTGGVGDGTFSGPTSYGVMTGPRGVATGDFNEDGIPDLAVGTDSGISILLGTGTGGFLGTVNYASSSVWGMGVGDFNEDGISDIVATGAHTSLLLFRGLGSDGVGNGAFAVSIAGALTAASENVALADFDRDSHLDVAASGGIVFYGNGLAQFPRVTSILVPCGNGVATGFLNSDDLPDVVVTSSCNSVLHTFAGQGTSMSPAVGYVVGSTPTDVLITDLDRDGAADVVTTDLGASRLSTLYGRCPRSEFPQIVSFEPDSGVVGTTVALSGFGLQGVTSCTFNGVPATILDATSFLVHVTVPNFATTGPIIVATPLGTATSPGPFTVGIRPVVISATPDSGKLGTSVTLRGQYLSHTLRVSFGAAASNASFVTVSDEEIIAVVDTPAVTGPIEVVTVWGTTEMGTVTFRVIPPTREPTIAAVGDVPSDQGGRVLVLWNASELDVFPAREIRSYRLWRQSPVGSSMSHRGSDPFAFEFGAMADAAPGTYWEPIAEVPAAYLEGYAWTAGTFGDSTEAGVPLTTFFVQALTADPYVFYSSAPASGYSVDNTPPAPPEGVFANYAGGFASLRWRRNHEADLRGYEVHAGASDDFEPSPATRLAFVPDTSYIASTPGSDLRRYKVTAVDIHGNRGAFTLARPFVPAGVDAPTRAWLGVHPNPSRGAFTVSFRLPGLEPASLEVLDLHGRRRAERRIVAAGAVQDVALGGLNLEPGLYLVRITQAGLARTSRVTIVR